MQSELYGLLCPSVRMLVRLSWQLAQWGPFSLRFLFFVLDNSANLFRFLYQFLKKIRYWLSNHIFFLMIHSRGYCESGRQNMLSIFRISANYQRMDIRFWELRTRRKHSSEKQSLVFQITYLLVFPCFSFSPKKSSFKFVRFFFSRFRFRFLPQKGF